MVSSVLGSSVLCVCAYVCMCIISNSEMSIMVFVF